jgi:hypothetical protein
MNRTAVISALASAVLLGTSTPAAKVLLGSAHAVAYLGFRSVNRSCRPGRWALRLRLIEFTPTRLAFEIARTDHKYVEVTYGDLDAKHFSEVQRIVHIVFGVQG